MELLTKVHEFFGKVHTELTTIFYKNTKIKTFSSFNILIFLSLQLKVRLVIISLHIRFEVANVFASN